MFPTRRPLDAEKAWWSSRGCFGEVDDYATFPHARHPEHDEVMLVSNRPVTVNGRSGGGYNNGDRWHSDGENTSRPAEAAFLVARRLPGVGGETLFANMYLAYETLSPALQSIVERLDAVRDVSKTPSFQRLDSVAREASRKRTPPIAHPLVRVHPETGRKALYLSTFITHIDGRSDAESRPLIDMLLQHATRYELTYRHRWSLGDMVMWDNRCLMHLAVQDYDPAQLRHMDRSSTIGPAGGRVIA